MSQLPESQPTAPDPPAREPRWLAALRYVDRALDAFAGLLGRGAALLGACGCAVPLALGWLSGGLAGLLAAGFRAGAADARRLTEGE
jgi:hypothetical protein